MFIFTFTAQIGSSVLQSAETGEDDLVFVYNELHSRGLLKGYGSVTMDVVPCPDKQMSVAKLESVTGMNMRALAPGKDNFWLYAGVGICLVEYVVSQLSGIDPLQVLLQSSVCACDDFSCVVHCVCRCSKLFSGGS
jgi:hypothetical protein